jgi:hypothetical protein
MGGRIIARGIVIGIAAMALVVAIGAAWVWLSAIAFNPGHAEPYYQLYAQRVAPLIAITSGIPLLFAAGWLSGRGTRSPAAPLLPAITYILLDIVLVAAGGLWPPVWSLIVSWLTKLAAAWAGGALARRRRAA